jgi:hypothetical protein
MDIRRKERQSLQNPSLEAQDSRQLLVISGAFLLFGYFVISLMGPYIMLPLASQHIAGWTASDTAFIDSVIKDSFVQLLCGLPLAFCLMFPILASMVLLLSRFLRSNPANLKVIFATMGFIFGLVMYFPIQILLLFSAAL